MKVHQPKGCLLLPSGNPLQQSSRRNFHLLKSMFYFPMSVLKGVYHYWTFFFRESEPNGNSKQRGSLESQPLGLQPNSRLKTTVPLKGQPKGCIRFSFSRMEIHRATAAAQKKETNLRGERHEEGHRHRPPGQARHGAPEHLRRPGEGGEAAGGGGRRGSGGGVGSSFHVFLRVCSK